MKTVEIYTKKLTFLGYSKRTIEVYSHYLEKFLLEVGYNPYHITTTQIKNWLEDKDYSSKSVQNQFIGALKLFAREILGKKDIHLDKIKRPKKSRRLPKVIDHDFLIGKIQSIQNLKSKSIIAMGYLCGLRVSETINLKIKDIDSDRMVINVLNSKGNKDRIVKLPQDLLDLLRDYFKEHKPIVYLFNGASKTTLKYSASSCNKLVKKYIGESYSYHSLRHSYATFLLDNETNLRIIQNQLGHASARTTEIYTHVSTRTIESIKTPSL